jgi:hypothetical protein
MRFSLKIQQYPNNELRATLYRATSGRQAMEGCAASGSGAPAPLDLSPKLSPGEPSLKPGYGGTPKSTRFGLNAKRTIQRASGVFDHDKIPKSELIFLTGTIPGGTRAAFDAVAKWSSWMIKGVKTWLSNLGVVDNYSMYCWEYQKRGALHIHYLVWVPSDETRKMVMAGWKEKWAQLLDSVGERSGIDIWEKADGGTWKHWKHKLQAPAQVVIKSVGSYLSKYLSKNSPSPNTACDHANPPLCPCRWWGVSRPLLKRLAELSCEFVIEEIAFYQWCNIWDDVRYAFQGLASEHHEYRDKLGWSRILVAFDEDSEQVYNYLWRDHSHGYSSYGSSV